MKKQFARLRKWDCGISSTTCQVKPYGRLLVGCRRDAKARESKGESLVHAAVRQTVQGFEQLGALAVLGDGQRALGE